MKLYSADLSPFAGRARMAILLKGLDVEIVPPPGGGLKSPDFLAINPMGKIPTLVTDDGLILPESETIVEYLEDKFPTPSLRGASPEETAKARLVARVFELYAVPHMQALFGQMDPRSRDAAKTEDALAKFELGLASTERLMPESGYAAGEAMTTADCLIAPMLFFLPLLSRSFDRDFAAANPRLGAYHGRMKAEPVYQECEAAMQRGLEAMRAGR